MHPSHRALLQHHLTARPGNVFCRGSELSGVWRTCHLDISQQSESRWRRNASPMRKSCIYAPPPPPPPPPPKPQTPNPHPPPHPTPARAKGKGRCLHTDGLMQEGRNSSALAMKLRLSFIIYHHYIILMILCTVIIVRIHDHMLDTHCAQLICIFAIHIIHTHSNT